jgi:hypothetical protein
VQTTSLRSLLDRSRCAVRGAPCTILKDLLRENKTVVLMEDPSRIVLGSILLIGHSGLDVCFICTSQPSVALFRTIIMP